MKKPKICFRCGKPIEILESYSSCDNGYEHYRCYYESLETCMPKGLKLKEQKEK